MVYAASPGKPALDRLTAEDSHSPFTMALITELPKPGVHSFEVFGRVEESVLRCTGSRQKPRIFYNGSTLPFRNFNFASSEPMLQPVAGSFQQSSTPMPPPAVSESPPPVLDTPELPEAGFFDLNGLFRSGPYANFNTYSRTQILRQAQTKLKTEGLYTSAADGLPGPGTQKALLQWQRSRGLQPLTGRLDGATLEGLSLTGIAEQMPPEGEAPPAAPSGGRPTLYFFTASWCPPCATMKKNVLSTAKVQQALKNFDYRIVDVDAAGNDKLRATYNVQGIPHFVITTRSGKLLSTQTGATDASTFLNFLDKGIR